MNTIKLLGITMVVVCCLWHERPMTNPIGDFIEPHDGKRILARREWLKGMKARLHESSDLQLRKMRLDIDSGIALAGAWESVRRSLHAEEGGQRLIPSRHTMDWFIGYLEGRLNVQLPDWWTEMLRSAYGIDGDQLCFDMPKKWPYRRTDLGFAVPNDTEATAHGEFLHVLNDRRIVRIDQEIVTEYRRRRTMDALVIHLDSGRAFVALHSDRCSPYYVFSVPQPSGKVVNWAAEVWAEGGWLTYEGRGCHFVSIQTRGEGVFIFGAGESVLYVEGFDVESGKNTLRFSTAYAN